MTEQITKEPESESVRAAMDEAWREHQHARDQTWRGLQMMIALVAGLVAVEVQFHNAAATVAVAALVTAQSIAGLLIAKHHRAYQRRKFTHIMNCEEWLGLRRDDLISEIEVPSEITWLDLFRVTRHNTVLFIMRMHLGFIVFAVMFAVASVVLGNPT